MVGLAILVGALLGVLLYAAWLRKQASAALRLPEKWPLTARVVVINEEHDVLVWLRATFHDHLVMVKLPVLRFMAPTDKHKSGGGVRWREILNGVYCTFTICTVNGHVVGCVDVVGKRGMSKASRDLKNALLSDCHIAYTLVRSNELPKGTAMRTAFLGEMAIDDQVEPQETRGGDSSFHADLDSFTRKKRLEARKAALRELNKGNDIKPLTSQPAGFNPDGTGAFGRGSQKSRRSKPQFEDSFAYTDESRPRS